MSDPLRDAAWLVIGVVAVWAVAVLWIKRENWIRRRRARRRAER